MRNVAMIECIANNIGNIIINSDEITSLNEVCISINNLNLYQKLYNNIINEIYISISESVIHEYHEKKKNGEIFGESTYNRTKYFEENFAEKLEFTYYFLEKYNVLRELLTIRVSDLIKFYKEIILNYNKDKDIIKDILKNNLGEISNIMLNAGDLHNGKAVSIIKLKNGKIVYKPRKIEGEIIVEKFIKYISEYLPKKIIFKFPKYVTRENYTWQEFICQKECVNMDQVHNYYYKTGIYLGIFYLFSTVDIHYENMISHGEDPIFIDLETLVRAETSIDNLNQDRKVDSKSVLISSLIPVKSVGNFFDVNMSALFTGIQKSENIYNTILVPDEKEDWVYMKKQAIVKGQQNILIYNGKEVEPYLVEKDLIQGFKDSMDIVISNKKCFKKLLYKDNNNIKIRQILRPTHIYWKFIDASHSPVYLSSSEKYNSIFDILYSKFTFGKHGFMRVEKEVEDLKKGNIPLFYTFMGDKNLYADGNLICSDYYIETPLDTIVRKINHLDNELISYQIRLIRMSFLSLYGFDKPVNKIHSEKEREILSKSDIKNILDEYSNYLSKNLIQIDENKYSILSPVIDREGYIIDGLKSGIYEIGGVIWYLAVYSKLYNSDYSKYAKGMLNTLISQYTKEKMLKKEEMNFSVYGGEGGLLYLVYNFYKIFGEELYLDMTIEIIKDFVKYYNNTNAKCGIDDDFYRGLPGILYVICNIFDNFKLEHNKLICDLNDLVVIGDKLIELIDTKSNNNYGFVHGLSGLAVTLSGLYKITEENKYVEKIIELLNNENKLYSENQNVYSWCKGKTGVILARHIISTNCTNNYSITKYIENCSPTFSQDDEKFINHINEYGLCHGLYGILDILNECKYDQFNEQIYTKYFDSLLDIKWFEHSEYKQESFMTGAAGVAYALMRIYNKLPSTLSLDIYS